MGISFSLGVINMIEMYRDNKIENKNKKKNKNKEYIYTKNITENNYNKNIKNK